jgi:hypothetical protein
MPNGCALGLTQPDSKPPIYPFTGWYCDSWVAQKLTDEDKDRLIIKGSKAPCTSI